LYTGKLFGIQVQAPAAPVLLVMSVLVMTVLSDALMDTMQKRVLKAALNAKLALCPI